MPIKKLELSERAREILFWFTVAMIAIVAIVALVTILQACSNIVAQSGSPLEIDPPEARLCSGEQTLFSAGGEDVTWEASGGDISQSGLFTAGAGSGEYVVTASDRGSSRTAQAIVRVVACTPTPSADATATPPPVETATPEIGSFTTADARDDIVEYQTGAPAQESPTGIDIQAASVRADLRVSLEPGAQVPPEFVDWVEEGEVLFWIALYEPIPDPPGTTINWVLALDLDGDTSTGRPPGTRSINPDLGDEAVVQVTYDLGTGSYTGYLYIWNPDQGNWEELAGALRFEIDRSRTLIGMAVDLQALTDAVEQASGVSLDPTNAMGRAAAQAVSQGVIDFSPDLPQ